MAVRYTQLMLYEDADSAMLRMMECFMEAAPQLLLQLYIIFTQEKHKQTFQSKFYYDLFFSILMSSAQECFEMNLFYGVGGVTGSRDPETWSDTELNGVSIGQMW